MFPKLNVTKKTLNRIGLTVDLLSVSMLLFCITKLGYDGRFGMMWLWVVALVAFIPFASFLRRYLANQFFGWGWYRLGGWMWPGDRGTKKAK